ncbi:hypothetical protein L227DRAFT_581975 [Lentinus tigrinus ALCF2SS1-6]|uniref:Uncharacterized protein n=1 Tax=Lentinus tigrinus ALCF2SS1-6 TaxID=1328759 RepID=A0A5C2RQF0_9APHY|nr:hypothetical protein L227DRAFT_581975 [Lentinus tigrinus ALCF2SS1-6]
MPSYCGEVLCAGIYPSFSSSYTLLAHARNGVPVDEPELVYGEGDKRTLEEWIRTNVSTA